MKKCMMISDSFKGTLSSRAICALARESVASVFPACEVVTIPVADGGEGTVESFYETCGGELVTCRVQGPLGDLMDAVYLKLDGDCAVIEMASAAGLPLVGERKDPCRASTYGVGEQIRSAVESGCRKIILGLGGSATNDGGCGCAAALGVEFRDQEGKLFCPTGGTLGKIAAIDVVPARHLLQDVTITVMCDIDNPLYGPEGAAAMFAPQKGADADTVAFLDQQLRHLDSVIRHDLHKEVALIPGAGAAGGFGAGMMAFFDANLQSGIETVLDTVGFDEKISGCDVVFTGEGRVDGQSLHGKVISGVASRARAHHVPVVVIAGGVTAEAEKSCRATDSGIDALFSTTRLPLPLAEIAPRSAEFYRAAFENILHLIALSEQFH